MIKPVIHLYTLCYNEEFILPYFLRHYLQFVDLVTIHDNFSTDNSREIALGFGEKVKWRTFGSNNEFNDLVHLEIKNNCWKESAGKADLVIVCDADEFLYHADWSQFFEDWKKKAYTIATPAGYDMVSESRPVGTGQIYEEIHEGIRALYLDKTILFDPALITTINYSAGSHSCQPEGQVKWFPESEKLKLLHFRYFGLDNLMNKYRVYSRRLSAVNRQNGWGYHYDLSPAEQEQLWQNLLREKREVIKSV